MAQQVITIRQDGSMETLRQKKGQGIDLRDFGAVQMERVSEISIDEESQLFYVHFLLGELAGRDLSVGLYGFISETDYALSRQADRVTFPEYEDAVEAEILVLNALRARGDEIPQALLDILCPPSKS